jgi:PAS domain S-box-containing protein
MKYFKYVIILFFIFLICSYALYSAYNEVKLKAIDQLNNQQLLLAKEASKGINNYFEERIADLSFFAKNTTVINYSERWKEILTTYYENHQDKIISLLRLDTHGSILFSLPSHPNLIGQEISFPADIHQEILSQEAGISDVFKSSHGHLAVAVHTPIFNRNKYQGALVMLLPVAAIAKEYLKDIKIGDDGYAWIMCRQGVELYCPVPGHIGQTVFDNCQEFPSILAMGHNMIKGKEGKTTYSYDRIRGETVEVVTKHAVYLPIPLGKTFWSIVVATPESEVLTSLQHFRNHLLYIAFVLFVTVFLTSFLFVKAVIIIKEEEKRNQVEQALRASEAKYRLLVENAPIGIMHFDTNGVVTDINEKFREIIGSSQEKIIGFNLLRQLQDDQMLAAVQASLEGRVGYYEGNYVSVNAGKVTPARAIYNPVFSPEGNILGGVSIFEDITARKKAVDALRASLAEKVALLKEVHHRVKNNLQIVASLLRLQANRTPDQNVVDVLQDTRNRVHSMALLHEVLYRSTDLGSVNFADYVEDLTKHLRRSCGPADGRIIVENSIVPFSLPLDKSLTCGLIINELVANALKHAFPGNRSGNITVTMEPAAGQQFVLSIQDNGIGLPADRDVTKTSPTLGLRLVANLVGQLRGILAAVQPDGGGVLFRIIFPIPPDTSFEGKA